jgi:hypothetical protein
MAVLWVSSELHKKLGRATETQIHAGNSTINDYYSLQLNSRNKTLKSLDSGNILQAQETFLNSILSKEGKC